MSFLPAERSPTTEKVEDQKTGGDDINHGSERQTSVKGDLSEDQYDIDDRSVLSYHSRLHVTVCSPCWVLVPGLLLGLVKGRSKLEHTKEIQ